LGDISTLIAELRANNDIASLLEVCFQYLETFNHEDAWGQYSRLWFDEQEDANPANRPQENDEAIEEYEEDYDNPFVEGNGMQVHTPVVHDGVYPPPQMDARTGLYQETDGFVRTNIGVYGGNCTCQDCAEVRAEIREYIQDGEVPHYSSGAIRNFVQNGTTAETYRS
jgi:hypothetical protein